MPVISNSGPLLSFARAGQFELIQAVLGELIVPDAVYEDIVVLGSGRAGATEVSRAVWIKRRSVQHRGFLDRLPQKLHLGEREAIALARELSAPLFIDEREARKEAERLGVPIFGSLRILKEAKDRALLIQVKPILDDLIRSGTFIGKALYAEFLRLVGEE